MGTVIIALLGTVVIAALLGTIVIAALLGTVIAVLLVTVIIVLLDMNGPRLGRCRLFCCSRFGRCGRRIFPRKNMFQLYQQIVIYTRKIADLDALLLQSCNDFLRFYAIFTCYFKYSFRHLVAPFIQSYATPYRLLAQIHGP